MTSFFRTAAIAAASFGFAAAIASAAPSVAGENPVAQTAPVYTDHATATITSVGTPAAPVRELNSQDLQAMGRAIKSVLPGVQYPDSSVTQQPMIAQPPTLEQLVADYTGFEAMDGEKDCLARAIYYEARGEPLEGQLAVANVVLNRTTSGRYPTGICEVVRQPAQFSFVRRGYIPAAPHNEAWRKAVAIAHISTQRFAQGLQSNVLWYHADYVAPSWGRRLTRVTKIGAHIFYS